MRLVVTGSCLSAIALQWESALVPMVIRHPDPAPTVELELTYGNPPQLSFRLDSHRDTVEPCRKHSPFNVSTTMLTYFPGQRLARAWVAAAWAGYVMHEALELVTVDGVRPIDPHASPSLDVCLRVGIPPLLTPDTLRASLGVVMTSEAVSALMEAA